MPVSRTSTPPNDAPDDTPRMSALASGLRKTAWVTAPVRARPAPTMIASRTRGSRTSMTTVYSCANHVSLSGRTCPSRMRTTSLGGTV